MPAHLTSTALLCCLANVCLEFMFRQRDSSQSRCRHIAACLGVPLVLAIHSGRLQCSTHSCHRQGSEDLEADRRARASTDSWDEAHSFEESLRSSSDGGSDDKRQKFENLRKDHYKMGNALKQ